MKKIFSEGDKVSNVNLYSRFLEEEEAVEVTSGSLCGQPGDYLAWQQMELTLTGKENILREEVSQASSS